MVVFRKLVNSFHFASDGITYTILTQRNMKIHVAISLFVLLIGMWLHFTFADTIYILLAIGMVMGMELINTAVETVVDLVMPHPHPLAKIAKDVAAGSVLLVTFIVIMMGVLIISPYLETYFFHQNAIRYPSNRGFFGFLGTFLLIITYIFKAFWSKKSQKNTNQPQIFVGIFLYISSLMFIIKIIYSLIPILLTVFLLIKRFKQGYTIVGFIQNIILSVGGFYSLYFWLY